MHGHAKTTEKFSAVENLAVTGIRSFQSFTVLSDLLNM